MSRQGISLAILIASFAVSIASADTIYLKNGGSVEGIIEKEDAKRVEMNMGFGTVTFRRSQIKDIKRSTLEESYAMSKRWEEKRKELGEKEKDFEEARDRRSKDAYDSWVEDARERKLKSESEAKEVRITRDDRTRSIVVETLLNEKVKANLILDTGAAIIALSRNIGEELGIDLSDTKKDIMELKLADGRSTLAKCVILDSVKIQDVEVKKVMAAVMLDQVSDPLLKDGLLGMSFLNKFNLKMDLKSMKLSLEKIMEHTKEES